MTYTIGTLAPYVPPVICDFGWDSGLPLYTYVVNSVNYPPVVASYSATANYGPTADVRYSSVEYVCLEANGPLTTVVTPGTNSAVWESFPGRFNYYQTPLQTIVTFDATDSESLGQPKCYVPPGVSIIAYQWVFGNGKVGYGPQPLTEYFYNQAPPDIQVMLTVTDSLGRTFSCAHFIELTSTAGTGTGTGYAGYQIGAGAPAPHFTVSVTDSVTLTDSGHRAFTGTRHETDAIATGESVSLSSPELIASVTDTLNLVDVANVISSSIVNVTGTLGLSESVSSGYPGVSTIIDNFPGTSLNAQWNAWDGTSTVASNQLTLACTSGYSEITTNSPYTLAANSVSFYCNPPAVGNKSKESGLTLAVIQGAGGGHDQFAWNCFYGSAGSGVSTLWYPYSTQGGVTTFGPTVAYGVGYFRIREVAGVIYYDHAPDNATWTNIWSTTYTISITALWPTLFSGYDTTETASNAIFAKVNYGGTVGDVYGAPDNYGTSLYG